MFIEILEGVNPVIEPQNEEKSYPHKHPHLLSAQEEG